MDSLTTLVADGTGIKEAPSSIVRLKSIGYLSLCGHRGSPRDVIPALISSRMSPTNSPPFLIPTYLIVSFSSDMLNNNILDPSHICNDMARLQSAVTNLNPTYPRITMDMATIPSTSEILMIEPSVSSDHHTHVHISSRSENCLSHLIIPFGKKDQVTASLIDKISQVLFLLLFYY